MDLKLNLNCVVKVKLTTQGFQCAAGAGFQDTASRVDDKEYSSFQLWNLMEIFGKTSVDLDNLIQPFEIIIDSADLHGK
jgi:hypothetical protein